MKPSIILALSAIFFALTALSALAGEVMVTDSWIRAAPPNAPALGVFMKLENHTESGIALVEVQVSIEVDRIELHRTMMVNGIMKMTPQIAISVAAQSAVVLKPGSWHIMLISPKKVPVVGERVGLTLIFDDGSEREISAVVRKGEMAMNHNHEVKSMESTAD